MEVTKLVPGMSFGNITVGRLTQGDQNAYRARANHIASTVLGSSSSLYCTESLDQENTPPSFRTEVSAEKLQALRMQATQHHALYEIVGSLDALMLRVDQKIEVVDFSNRYDEVPNTLNPNANNFMWMHIKENAERQKESLFNTFVTIEGFFQQRCGYLVGERNPQDMLFAFRGWFDAAMGNLVIRFLREVAENNRVALRGQLNAHRELSRTRVEICTHLGALSEEENPQRWKQAAIQELETFLDLERQNPRSEREIQIVRIYNKAVSLLEEYS